MKRIRPIIEASIGVAVTAASLYVILSGSYDDATRKWAFGMIGTQLGYWLRRR